MIICLSASHKKTKLPLLELLVFKNEEKAINCLCSEGIADECVLVQTCNRIEVYCVVKDFVERESFGAILKFWSANTGISLDILTRNIDCLKGREALRNLFNVASGLDSMAVGEDQILGQVRAAHARAKMLGSTGLLLDKAFMSAINAGKKVRNATRINQGSISISSAAVDLASKELGDLKQKTALVVGAGKAGSIAAQTLRRRGVKSIIVTSRTHNSAAQLARKVSGKSIEFEEIYDMIPQVDVTIVALAVVKPVVRAINLRAVCGKSHTQRSVLIVDISQPRAVEDEVSSVPGVFLRNIDNLREVIEESVRNKQVEAEKAARIVLDEVARFERQQSELIVEPFISEVFRWVESVRQKELKRALSKMPKLDEKRAGILDRFSRELVERILQMPIDQLRKAALSNDDSLLVAAKELFKAKQGKDFV